MHAAIRAFSSWWTGNWWLKGWWPVVTDADRQAVLDALRPDGEREVNEGLAADWAAYVGGRHCIPCNNGIAALRMCVAGIAVRPGEEVICPAFTYWATAAAVLRHNAIPVFVDIESETYCLDPTRIESVITERTRAILPVHIQAVLGGYKRQLHRLQGMFTQAGG